MRNPKTDKLRQISKAIVLRGPIRKGWVQRKARQLEKTFVDRFVETQRTPKLAQPRSQIRKQTASPIRTITFIADCMWEQYDLIPELSKIADIRTLDLHPYLSKGRKEAARAIATRTITDFVESATWVSDITFLYARPALLSEEIFHSIRRKWKGPLIGMNLDDKNEFFDYGIYATGNDNYKRWASLFDLTLSNSLPAIECYNQLGLPVHYFPQGCHPKPQSMQPLSSADFKYKFSFLGSWKPERAAIVEELERQGISLTLFGSGWKNSSWVEDAETVFRESQINLGIGFFSPNMVLTNLKGRDFECPGAGACYLTSYNWELANLYDIGKEILCYRSVEELIEMYVYYSKRPELCLQIAQAAHRRCMAEHTWEKRFREVLRSMGFSA
jgi:hypothetical protein